MTQNSVDVDFVDGLQLIIDSLIKEDEGSNLEDEDEDVNLLVNTSHTDEAGEESTEVEKGIPLAAIGAGLGALARGAVRGVGAVAQGVGELGGDGMEAVGEGLKEGQMGDKGAAGLPKADHWCPDVMDWHTSDHEPAKAPSVHINVDQDNGDDPYQSENSDIEKTGAAAAAPMAATVAEQLVGAAIGEKIANRVKKGEYDQNTNLPPEFGKPDEGESIAEPFLRKRESMDEDVEKQEAAVPSDSGTVGTSMPPSSMQQPNDASSMPKPEMTMAREYVQSFDVLKIWASVDRALPKDDDVVLVDDLSILKSFGLGTSTNVEDLVEGTLVHKMLVDRATRPTKEWWEAGIKLAEDMDNIDEPAICTAFLYYEPDTFNIGDFQKADPGSGGGETQDVQNVGSASAIDGLGMSADELPPEDKDCDT